jgi:hypothetical protein
VVDLEHLKVAIFGHILFASDFKFISIPDEMTSAEECLKPSPEKTEEVREEDGGG